MTRGTILVSGVLLAFAMSACVIESRGAGSGGAANSPPPPPPGGEVPPATNPPPATDAPPATNPPATTTPPTTTTPPGTTPVGIGEDIPPPDPADPPPPPKSTIPPQPPVEKPADPPAKQAKVMPLAMAQGRPKALAVGAPAGFWIWRTGNDVWHLRTTTGGVKHVFGGSSLSSPGPVLGVRPTRVEFLDRLVREDKLVYFRYVTAGGMDGFDFKVPPNACVRFLLKMDGKPAANVKVGSQGVDGTDFIRFCSQ